MAYRTMQRGGLRLALGLAAVVLVGCGRGNANEGNGDATALVLNQQDVATAQYGELRSGLVLTGSLMPYLVVPVKAQVSGTVENVRVDRGVPVHRGQLMADIRAQGIRSQAAGAQAAVAAARSNLALANQKLESARTLRDAGAMSDIDYQAAEAAHEAAKAQLAAAEAQAAGAEEAAGHTNVVAPIDGVVSDRRVEGGEAVSPGTQLFTVVNSSKLELAGQVPVDRAAAVRVGQPVEFTLDGDPGEVFRGAVSRVEPVANTETRQVGVWVRLPNPDRKVIAGQFATGRILVQSEEQVLLVPATAVRGSGSERYVLVVQGEKVVRRPVNVGGRNENTGMAAIRSGLREGETVIAAPGTDVADGTRVQVVGSGTPAEPVADTAAERKEG